MDLIYNIYRTGSTIFLITDDIDISSPYFLVILTLNQYSISCIITPEGTNKDYRLTITGLENMAYEDLNSGYVYFDDIGTWDAKIYVQGNDTNFDPDNADLVLSAKLQVLEAGELDIVIDDLSASSAGYDITLTWTNQIDTIPIEVYRDDVLIDTLAAGTETYEETVAAGTYDYKLKYSAQESYSNEITLEITLRADIAIFDRTPQELQGYSFNLSAWEETGTPLIIDTGGNNIAIAGLTGTRIAALNAGTNKLYAYDFNGTFVQVGNPSTSIGSLAGVAICALSNSSVAIMDTVAEVLEKWDFDGNNWTQDGNGLIISGLTGRIAIAGLTSTTIAYIDEINDDLRVYTFDGTNWSQTGNDLNLGTVIDPALTALSNNRIAFVDSNNDQLRIYDWNGMDWQKIGNSYGLGNINAPAICALSTTRIAYIDATADDLRTYEFDGTDWAEVPTELNISGLTRPYIASMIYQIF